MSRSSDSTEAFAKRLRQARELRNLRQRDLAHRTGFQPSAVSHFESGSRKQSFDNLRRLADALEVTTDFLLGRVDDMAGHAGAQQLHRHFELLSSKDREIADDFIQMLVNRGQDP